MELNKREQLAALAMAAMIRNCSESDYRLNLRKVSAQSGCSEECYIANMAVEHADALIIVLNEVQNGLGES